MIKLHTTLVGQPETITDQNGTWRSSIYRKPVTGAIELGERGLAGDQVTDTQHHGSPDQAVCCHSLEHYAHWNDVYGLLGSDRALGPGSVGENWTLVGADEAEICVGDVYQVGHARVQVTGARIPCSKQERKLGLEGFQKRTLETLRTGFYLRVLTPGTVQAGDAWRLEKRPHPRLTLRALNGCAHHEPDAALAQRLIEAPALAASWRQIFQRRLGQEPTA